jgi:hypothetical protein
VLHRLSGWRRCRSEFIAAGVDSPYVACMTILIALLLAVSAQAVQVEVQDRDGKILIRAESTIALPATAGALSLDVFNAKAVPFEGGEAGFSKIFGMGNEIEVVSETEMKAWGWCYSVDSVEPDQMPDLVQIQDPKSVIVWFYAYAGYKDGQWVSYCARDL